MENLQSVFARHLPRSVASFSDLDDLEVLWTRTPYGYTVTVSDVFEDAPAEVLDEIAERVSLRLDEKGSVSLIGEKTYGWLAENRNAVRSRLRASMGALLVGERGGWEIWLTDSVRRVEVRDATRLVLAPKRYIDAPPEVMDWLYSCASRGEVVTPSYDVKKWMWSI